MESRKRALSRLGQNSISDYPYFLRVCHLHKSNMAYCDTIKVNGKEPIPGIFTGKSEDSPEEINGGEKIIGINFCPPVLGWLQNLTSHLCTEMQQSGGDWVPMTRCWRLLLIDG